MISNDPIVSRSSIQDLGWRSCPSSTNGGDDNIIGGEGDDLLTGGEGADIFSCGEGEDTVTDFNEAEGDIATPDCENV